MWLADMPAADQAPPAIYLAAKTAPQGQTGKPHRFGVCQAVSRDETRIMPIFDAVTYVGRYLHWTKNLDTFGNPPADGTPDTTITIVKPPRYGRLEEHYPDATNHKKYEYVYVAETDMGTDHFVILVQTGGAKVEVHYTMSIDIDQPDFIFDGNGNRIPDPSRCPKEEWKISLAPTTLDPSSLQSLLAATHLDSSVTVDTADFPDE
jgi:hypothetical protein